MKVFVFHCRVTNSLHVTVKARDRKSADKKLEKLVDRLDNVGVRLPTYNVANYFTLPSNSEADGESLT